MVGCEDAVATAATLIAAGLGPFCAHSGSENERGNDESISAVSMWSLEDMSSLRLPE